MTPKATHETEESDAAALRQHVRLTDEQIQRIARAAAKTALDQVYAEVGKSVLRKAGWLIAVLLLALLIYLGSKNALGPLAPPHS